MNNKDIELLSVIYRLFYNEKINFKDKNIYIKINTMLSILKEFNNYLGIENLELLDIEAIKNKKILYRKRFESNNSMLNNETKELITTLGNVITKHLPNGFEGIDALIEIIKLINEDNTTYKSYVKIKNN